MGIQQPEMVVTNHNGGLVVGSTGMAVIAPAQIGNANPSTSVCLYPSLDPFFQHALSASVSPQRYAVVTARGAADMQQFLSPGGLRPAVSFASSPASSPLPSSPLANKQKDDAARPEPPRTSTAAAVYMPPLPCRLPRRPRPATKPSFDELMSLVDWSQTAPPANPNRSLLQSKRHPVTEEEWRQFHDQLELRKNPVWAAVRAFDEARKLAGLAPSERRFHDYSCLHGSLTLSEAMQLDRSDFLLTTPPRPRQHKQQQRQEGPKARDGASKPAPVSTTRAQPWMPGEWFAGVDPLTQVDPSWSSQATRLLPPPTLDTIGLVPRPLYRQPPPATALSTPALSPASLARAQQARMGTVAPAMLSKKQHKKKRLVVALSQQRQQQNGGERSAGPGLGSGDTAANPIRIPPDDSGDGLAVMSAPPKKKRGRPPKNPSLAPLTKKRKAEHQGQPPTGRHETLPALPFLEADGLRGDVLRDTVEHT